MFIYLFHLILGIFYLSMFPSNIFLIGFIYFVFLIPALHRSIIYYLLEFKIPPWTIVMKCFVHMSLFSNFHQKVNIMFIWMLIYVWNDLLYVVRHAEKRLSKIDSLLYEHNMRISHLYIDTYSDDITNRFHTHLFDTNRMYWFDKTEESNKTSLGIHNYRNIVEPTQPDNTMLNAAKGYTIFIRNRYIICLPALFVFVYSGFIDFRWNYLTLLNMLILCTELLVLVLNTRQFYITSNILLVLCIFLANQVETVYLIQPINTE